MSKKQIILSILLFSCYLANAQSDTMHAVTLDEVIVTANKLPQKQSTTGKVVSVITKSDIERSAGKTVGEVLNEQAGVTINGALNNLGANQTIYMRGAASGRTLILLDGIPVYDPTYINNDFDINLLSLNNIERIEICRGSQSTAYGSDAIAGVINIISIDPENKKKINFKAGIAAGNYGTFRTNEQLYGRINQLQYSLKFAEVSSNGFSSAYDSTGKKSFANNKYNGNSESVSLQYWLTGQSYVRAYLQNNQYKTNLDAGAFTDEKDYTVNNKSLLTGLSGHYHKNDISVTANYQYNKTTRFYLNDSTDTPTFVKYSTDNYFGETQFAEVYSTINLTRHFTFLEGADYRFSSFHSAYHSLSAYGPYDSKFNDTSLSQSSLYGSILYHGINDRLNIELGGRLNVHSRYGSNSTYTLNPSFSLSKYFRIFGSIESGFKAPSLYQLYSGYGNGKLLPETSKTYEAGVQIGRHDINLRVVYFDRDIKDGLDFDYNNYIYYNFNRQVVNGLEFELNLKPIKGLEFSANYTYIHPEEDAQSRITFNDTSYTYLLRRPANTLNLKAGYQCHALYLSITGKYVSSRYDASGYQQPDVLLDPYFILGAYAEYRFNKHVKAFTDLQNITNKKFFDIRGYNSIPFLINCGFLINI